MSAGKAKKPHDENEDSFGGIIMRLSKDERRLLAFYAKKAGQRFGNVQISDDELIKLLKFFDKEHLHNVKKELNKLGLISFTHLEKYKDFLNVNGRRIPKDIDPNVTVTQEGFDLGMKYTTLFGTFQVWCKEYYWLWAFIAALASIVGIIVMVIIAVFSE
jgi:hypothetical protein